MQMEADQAADEAEAERLRLEAEMAAAIAE